MVMSAVATLSRWPVVDHGPAGHDVHQGGQQSALERPPWIGDPVVDVHLDGEVGAGMLDVTEVELLQEVPTRLDDVVVVGGGRHLWTMPEVLTGCRTPDQAGTATPMSPARLPPMILAFTSSGMPLSSST